MKRVITLLILVAAPVFLNGQVPNPAYDKELAGKLGGNDNGMKSYVLVILKTGTNNITDKVLRDSLFAGHMNNIKRLADLGKLIVAGPFGTNDKGYRGIFLFNVASVEEARELVMTDPTVKEKVFDAEILPWYGSAAIPEYLKYHDRIIKTKE